MQSFDDGASMGTKSNRSIYKVQPKTMATLARFLSWLLHLQPILARKAILGGALGQACTENLRPMRVYSSDYVVVRPSPAEAIIAAYKGDKLPMKDGVKIGKTARAAIYARSPLSVPRFDYRRSGNAELLRSCGEAPWLDGSVALV